MNELPLQALIELVRAAGQAILPYWRQPLEVSEKSDSSPVTAADLAAPLLAAEDRLRKDRDAGADRFARMAEEGWEE